MHLYLLSQSPFNSEAFASTLALATADDTVMLINDAVYAALPGTAISASIAAHPARFMALDDDLLARGVDASPSPITVIDMDAFVRLVFAARHCITGY
ncbi:MAG TPA: sulfurtransferase complex subunit TusB [Pseudomonadales bacterium]